MFRSSIYLSVRVIRDATSRASQSSAFQQQLQHTLKSCRDPHLFWNQPGPYLLHVLCSPVYSWVTAFPAYRNMKVFCINWWNCALFPPQPYDVKRRMIWWAYISRKTLLSNIRILLGMVNYRAAHVSSFFSAPAVILHRDSFAQVKRLLKTIIVLSSL